MRIMEGTARVIDTIEVTTYAPDGTPKFTTKDSGARIDYESGMRRDVQTSKPRYDLIPLMPLRRLAELYTRGAEKYGDRNWQLANSPDELERFKGSAFRHLIQWLEGDVEEDHAIAAVWNVFAALYVEDKMWRDDADDCA